MTEVMFSEEEKETLCMGDIALDRASYERRIQELERRLKEIDRHTKAAFEEKEKEHQRAVEKAKDGYRGSIGKINQLDAEVQRLRRAVQNASDTARDEEAREGYYEQLSKQLAKAKKEDPIRLITELENAKIMMILLHKWGTGANSTEQSNLIAAMRHYAKETLGFDVDDFKHPSWGYINDMMEEHIRSIWQPHKVITGAWTKDADSSLQPFRGIIKKKDEE